MPWAVQVEDTQVRLNDLTLAAILRVLDGEDMTEQVVLQLLAQPLSNFPRAVKIAEEAAKTTKVTDPDQWVAGYLDRSWLDFTKLFVEVEDDLPSTVFTDDDGNVSPTEGDAGPTA